MLPANFFDSGQSICPSKVFLDLECLGCGITRASQHLIHLEFAEAWAFNELTFIVLPIFAFFWAKWGIKEWRKYRGFKIEGDSPIQDQ